MIDIIESERRRAFSVWLRTGRLPVAHGADGRELKFNPWHDPRDGRFTFAGTGKYYAQGWGDWGLPEKREQNGREARKRAPIPAAIANKPAPRIAPKQALSRARPVTRVTITRNGYAFELDANARMRKVSGYVSTTQAAARSRSAQTRAGGADRRPGDDGGHYIARRFNGPTDAFNHFAQDAKVNRGRYRALEDQWAREKSKGKSVWVKIVPVFEGKSQRPSSINVWFRINRKKHSLNIPN